MIIRKVVIDFDSAAEGNNITTVATTGSLIENCFYQKHNGSDYVATKIGAGVRSVKSGESNYSYITYHEELNIEYSSVFDKTDNGTYTDYKLKTF